MSSLYIKAIISDNSLKGTTKSIAMTLAVRANKTGVCWPSIRTIANNSGFSISSSRRAVHTLRNMKYITVTHRFRHDGSYTSNLYKFLPRIATQTIKHVTTEPVKMNLEFDTEKIQPIKPTTYHAGQQALLELSEVDQDTIVNRLTSKNNATLQKHLAEYGLNSAYVQKALFNEIQQFKREQKRAPPLTTAEKLMDRSWA